MPSTIVGSNTELMKIYTYLPMHCEYFKQFRPMLQKIFTLIYLEVEHKVYGIARCFIMHGVPVSWTIGRLVSCRCWSR